MCSFRAGYLLADTAPISSLFSPLQSDTTSPKFSLAFEKALLSVSTQKEIAVQVVSAPTEDCPDCNKILYRSLTPLLPFSCKLVRFIFRHLKEVAFSLLVLIVTAYVTLRITRNRRLTHKVNLTYQKVCGGWSPSPEQSPPNTRTFPVGKNCPPPLDPLLHSRMHLSTRHAPT